MKGPKLKDADRVSWGAKTKNQQLAIDLWESGSNLILNGAAGTGKTFVALGLGFEDIIKKPKARDKVVIVRSAVPTRDVGFLPGSLEEKISVYEQPYRAIMSQIFTGPDPYTKALESGQLVFTSTSYSRGITMDNAVVIVDEMQNLSFHELDSIITRAGDSTRLIFSGDYDQTDFINARDKAGLKEFLRILDTLSSFETVSFTWADIVRSQLVREYICAKMQHQKSSSEDNLAGVRRFLKHSSPGESQD